MTLHDLIQRLNQIGRQHPEALRLPVIGGINRLNGLGAPTGMRCADITQAWLVSDALVIEMREKDNA